MVINNYKIKVMRHLLFFSFFFMALSLMSQSVLVSSTDTTIVISTQGREYVAEAIPGDTVSAGVTMDSAFIIAIDQAVADWKSTVQAADRNIKRAKAKKVGALESIKILERKRQKAIKKGAAKVVTKVVEVDEIGEAGGVAGASDEDVYKSIMKKRDYKDAAALLSAYKRASDIAAVAKDLGIKDLSGGKTKLAERIVNHLKQ